MNESDYSVMTLFGRRRPRSIDESAVFVTVADLIVTALQEANVPLKCRGYIHGGPKLRGGKPSPSTIEKWAGAEKNSGLFNFEVFDEAWSDAQSPAAYGTIGTMHDIFVPPDGSRTGGAETYAVVALRESARGDAFDAVKSLARSLAMETTTIYGLVEQRVPWSRPHAANPLVRTDSIDLRWNDVSLRYAVAGPVRMSDAVPGLYRGNIVTERHLRSRPEALPVDLVRSVDRWDSLLFVELAGDPEDSPETAKQALRYFNAIEL